MFNIKEEGEFKHQKAQKNFPCSEFYFGPVLTNEPLIGTLMASRVAAIFNAILYKRLRVPLGKMSTS